MTQRSRTKWYYTDKGAAGTFIRAGFVRNAKAHGYEHDCIRLQIRSFWDGQGDIDIMVRLDEASSISAGLSLIAAKMSDGSCGHRALKRHAAAVEGGSL
jgi:hypothetical protein